MVIWPTLKKLFKGFFICIISLSLVYAIFLFVFIVKEPDFIVPVDYTSARIPIRSDSYGDGDFGAKRKNDRVHVGTDIAARINEPVYASKSGFAICKNLRGGYGKLVVIYHPACSETRYGHLSKFNIGKLGWVSQAEVIGYVGKTGNANYKNMKSHLHFEIRKCGKPVDPIKYLKGR